MGILEPGEQFGAYRLVSLLSRGGMGEVWRALKLGPSGSDWSRQVAIKVILPGLSDNGRFTDMFINEARIAAGLVHANIVGVTDFGREADIFWLEQELVEGEDLGRLIERAGPFPSPMALFVTIEALKGLAYAHVHRIPDGRTQTVIHRDIKPANVLIAREGHVKLTDFGISKISSGNPSQTELKGTIGYLAPELLEGQPPTVRSDLFAVGLVLWELLTGHKLFGGDNEAAKLMKTYECVVPPLAELGIWAPAPIEGILRRLLARDPAGRHASAEEVLADLLDAPGGRAATSLDFKAYLASLGVSELPAIDSSAPASAKRRSRTGTVAGQLTLSLPGRINRWFGSRRALAALAVVAAASVTAAITVHPRPAARVAAADAGVVAHPDAGRRLTAVRIDVTPADAVVTVNGRTLAGGAPYRLEEAPGTTLTVHAERAGYVSIIESAKVAGESFALPIELTEAAAAPAPDAPPAPRLRHGKPVRAATPPSPSPPAPARDDILRPDDDK